MTVELDNEAKVAIELTQELMKRLFPDMLDSREVDSVFGYTIGEMVQVIRSAKSRMKEEQDKESFFCTCKFCT